MEEEAGEDSEVLDAMDGWDSEEETKESTSNTGSGSNTNAAGSAGAGGDAAKGGDSVKINAA